MTLFRSSCTTPQRRLASKRSKREHRSASWQISRFVKLGYAHAIVFIVTNQVDQEELDSLNNFAQDSAKVRSEKLALSRQIDVLKPEMEHLKSQLAHQKGVLAEKLALERQLNALEVELANEKRAAERLAQKQQGLGQDAEDDLRQQLRDLEKQLVKEKRATEKAVQSALEVRSAEVELETNRLKELLAEAQKGLAVVEKQKKAGAKAAKAKGTDDSEAVAAELEQLRLELAETKKELVNEKKEKERIRKDGEKALTEAEGLRLPLEERVDNLKSKLRETREQLKDCRADLERAQQAAVTAAATSKVPTKKAAAAKAAPGGKKRRANEISAPEPSILQTPGKDGDRPRRTFKKPFAPAAVGEKSTFSITPFLNKTINLTEASLHPISEDEPEEQEEHAEASEPVAQEGSPSEVVPKKKQPRAKAKAALTESSPSKHNMPAPKSRKAPSTELTLDKVMEEAEEGAGQENQAPAPPPKQRRKMVLKNRTIGSESAAAKADTSDSATTTTIAATSKVILASATPTAAPAVAEPKKKKRKLVGGPATSVLFDGAADAEDAAAPPAAAVPAAAPVKRVPMGKAAGLAAKRAVGLGAMNAFAGASFSPLKRDRRGVGASFLA